jgi:hypothetical protein
MSPELANLSNHLHTIEGSPPRCPPRTLAQQGISTNLKGWRVVVRVASQSRVAARLLRELAERRVNLGEQRAWR